MKLEDVWQFDTKYGQPVVKDGCGVFGVIRKPNAPKISNLSTVSAISCIKYRGSDLGAGFASFEVSQKNQYKVMAFVKDSDIASEVLEQLASLLGKPVSSEMTIPTGSRSNFGVLVAQFRYSGHELELERKVDTINSRLLRDKTIDGRIFSYGRFLSVYKEVGYPMDVAKMFGIDHEVTRADMWIAHTRQPTNSPGSSPVWSHPFASLDCAIVHNGDISSFGANMEFLNSYGYKSHVGTDSEVISKLLFHLIRIEGLSVRDAATILTNPFEGNAPAGSSELLSRFRGAKLDGPFAVVAGYCDDNDSYLIALTDRSKFRPLILGEDENCYYAASEENQIRNISRNATIWTPDPGSYFIASLKKGLIESGTTRKVSTHSDAYPQKTFSKPSARVPEIDATGMDFSKLNQEIHAAFDSGAKGIRISNLNGQRYLGIGLSTKRDGNYIPFRIELSGVPGNCLANLNNGGVFEVYGNASDDLADTMHSGKVIVHGSARDVVAQTLQGGEIFVRGSVGNRAAIQMREYQSLRPHLIVGETADDYLGEYMAGGVVVILNLSDERRPVGNFVGTGMVGGKIYVRGKVEESQLGLAPKKADVLNYLKAAFLDGDISKEVFERLLSLDFPSEEHLLGLLPDSLLKRVRVLFFRNKYTKPCKIEYRKLNQTDNSVLEKLEEFFQVFNIPGQQRNLLLSSEYSIIRTIEEEDKDTPIPPQEVPVEE
jgi:glutamate synthase domain-containing protein 1/glutamate synthase domain-containing protein 3